MIRRGTIRLCSSGGGGRAAPPLIHVGASHAISRRFSREDVDTYIKLSGDDNPVHRDDDAARREGFKGCLVHGMLVASLFSLVMGTHLPGPGSIYMQQTLKFRRPVYIGENVTATVRVTGFDAVKGNIDFETTVTDASTGAVLIDGTALGRNCVVPFERPNREDPTNGAPERIPSVADRRAGSKPTSK